MAPDPYAEKRESRHERKRRRSPSESPPRAPRHRRPGSRERSNAGPSDRTAASNSAGAHPGDRSPPRQRKRPGQGARLTQAQKDASAAQARQREAEREARERELLAESRRGREGIHEAVREHYNQVPERGRDWRRTESKIKGLREYNNWVKSCLIQKFSASDDVTPGASSRDDPNDGGGGGGGGGSRFGEQLLVLDIGCGKGGDLFKWQKAPQRVGLYIGIDPANVSIQQARGRYEDAKRKSRGRVFHAEFFARDGFGETIGDIGIIRQVGFDPNVGPGGNPRWGGGGFDVVTMMFCMHYALESEEKARGMLKNVAGALKKGGRFIGAVPSSDVIRDNIQRFYKDWEKKHQAQKKKREEEETSKANGEDKGNQQDAKKTDEAPDSPNFTPGSPTFVPDSPPFVPDSPVGDEDEEVDGKVNGEKAEGTEPGETAEPVSDNPEPQWGNSLYNVRFPPNTPKDGIFRPPFGWKYSYFLHEAVEAPEYIVPFEAFRAMAEEYSLEMTYRKPFVEIFDDEREDRDLGPLSVRMGVTDRVGGSMRMTDEEKEAASFYLAFCFVKM